MIARHEDLDAYDVAFEQWYRSLGSGDSELTIELPSEIDAGEDAAESEAQTEQAVASWEPLGEGDEQPEPGDETTIRIVASAVEVLKQKSFGELTPEERARVARMIRELTLRVPHERTRRTRPAAKGATLDLRRTLRRSLRTQGEPFERIRRARRVRARPLLLLLDVSGSMSPYSRALLQFGFAAMAAGRRVEVFCFGTRLTRVTRLLRTRDPDRALHAIAGLVADWEGGTRIGESIKALLEGWSQRAALRGAVVVLCSDGLERGDPEVLRAQMARLRRLAHRVVWANPLKGSPRYEPLARGMAAALPSIDVFLSGHNLASLEELAHSLEGRAGR
jgi:uncharacterized protein with von Willebrand factor type A (vWA) domain